MIRGRKASECRVLPSRKDNLSERQPKSLFGDNPSGRVFGQAGQLIVGSRFLRSRVPRRSRASASFWRRAVADPRGAVSAGPEGVASHAIPGATSSGLADCFCDGGFWGLILCSLC